MYARIAHFEGIDTSKIDEYAARLKRDMEVARAGDMPEGMPPEAKVLMQAVSRWIQLVDRESGAAVGISFCKTEADVRRAHDALNAMSPGEGEGRRTSVGLYEVALDESFD
jgi:hypothetical protein